ncbi:MAG: amino acid permease [Gemmatimonadota bacterium]
MDHSRVGAAATGTNGNARSGHGFGTAPVFLASISTILGAIMFLRFGYAVGNVGMLGAFAIIVIGHMVTIPTALAIAEIATNRKVEGGGEYFIISRSFGVSIGGAIGIALFLSQAISVAFYMIAFAEAFRPLTGVLERSLGLGFDPRLVSIPATLALVALMLTRGAHVGVKALYVVVGTLAASLILFFLGSPIGGSGEAGAGLLDRVAGSDDFMLVFAICFPAFTGMTAGVGLSGDLANPSRSIPLGVMSAGVVGMLVYFALVVKLAMSASPAALVADPLVMSRIAVWGPIIPIGLAAATLSSALGSILVAPRTLQAIAADRVVPLTGPNRYLSDGVGNSNEPRNATIVTAVIAIVVVLFGSVNLVARIVSMFFMVTYGALCAISFLEHFAARPGYRPVFRSKWWLSLLGAIMCLLLMIQMDLLFALLALGVMGGLYFVIRSARGAEADDLAAIFHGVMTQASRYLQIRIQKWRTGDWRPSVIMITPRTFDRAAPFRFLSWLGHRYGFGTYLHYIPGYLNSTTVAEAKQVMPQLMESARKKSSAVYVDTIISPSMGSALAQSLQVPGVSGMENNTVMFEFSVHDERAVVDEVTRACEMASPTGMNRVVLRHGDHFFGDRRDLHVWLTWNDYGNAALMILMSYILLGHEDWRHGEMSIFAAVPGDEVAAQTERLQGMIQDGRIPVSRKNLRILPTGKGTDFHALVERRSADADLVVVGFTEKRLRETGLDTFLRFPTLRDVAFVSAEQAVRIE